MLRESNDIEIRKLPAGSIFKLIQILESSDGWKQLMAVIPIACKDGNPPKYTVEHMKLIENAGMCQKRPFSEILLEEWSTSGKCRPTVSDLLDCLLKAELYRAADFVAVELLKGSPPPRPESGPAAPVKCLSDTCPDFTPSSPPPRPESGPAASVKCLSDTCPDFTPSAPPAPPTTPSFSSPSPISVEHPTELVKPDSVTAVKLKYSDLEVATEQFAEPLKLGGGAWGTVYWANLPCLGAVAVKRLHLAGVPGDPHQQFRNEVEVLAELSHPNLLPLLGYSDDGPALCLAYKYMRYGSLLDQLACKNNRHPLSWRSRIEICLGTARGLCHLHTALQRPLVHRDVKSANILLGENFTPKLGDFGLVRLGSNANNTHTVALTTNVIGTSAYMAPEAYRGDVSVKMDVFSFGVVILELVSGLPPHDESREGYDLITHVDDADDRNQLVDQKAGNWPEHAVKKLFDLASMCLSEKKKRPFMPTVVEILES